MKKLLPVIVILLLGIWGSYDAVPEICELRTVRMCTAFIVGASLALSGTVFQAILRNQLAEPFILGISGGASVGAALVFIAGIHTLGFLMLPAGAFAGSILMLLLVIKISSNRNLLLSGVIAGTIANSLLMYLVSIAQSDELAGLTWWTLGDLQSADLALLIPAGAFLLAAALFLTFSARILDALSLGDEQAFYLGVSPRKFSVCFVSVGALLAANTVALAGIIGFCGLVVPHIIRRLYGSSHRKMLLPATLWGGAFLMCCDILSRLILPDREIPIGVITALIGGPVFLFLLNKRRFRYAQE